MGNKLYITNLASDVEGEDLEELFSDIGEVKSARVIKERLSRRSKGFGFVEMSNEEEAIEAITKLNSFELNGKEIRVEKAKPSAG